MTSTKGSAPRWSFSQMVTPEFRNASSRSRCSRVFRSKSIKAKVSSEGMKVTSVPDSGSPFSRFGATPVSFNGATESPWRNSIS